MKNPIMFLLITSVMLSACQHPGQQADKSTVLPIDSVSVVSDSSNMEAISPNTTNIDYPTLPDSARITLFHPYYSIYVDFSINHNKQSIIEDSFSSVKDTLATEYSFEILKKLGSIFIEHKTPVIISKKELPYHVSDEVPYVKFEIYYNDKTIKKDLWVAGQHGQHGHYEYIYSDSFLELFDLLFSTAYEFSESNEKKQ